MLSLFLAFALANGADCGLTIRNMNRPYFRELNPVARPFVTHGPALAAGYFAATTFATYEVAHQLEKHHHAKLAKIYVVVALGVEAWAVETSIRDK